MNNELLLERWMQLAGMKPVSGAFLLSEAQVPEAGSAEYIAITGIQQWISEANKIHPVAKQYNGGNFVTWDGQKAWNLDPLVNPSKQGATNATRFNTTGENSGRKSYTGTNSQFESRISEGIAEVKQSVKDYFTSKWPGAEWKVVNLFLHPHPQGHSDVIMAIQPYSAGGVTNAADGSTFDTPSDVFMGLFSQGGQSDTGEIDPRAFGLEVFQFHVKTTQGKSTQFKRFSALSANKAAVLDAALGTNIQGELVNMFTAAVKEKIDKFVTANGLRYQANENGPGIEILPAETLDTGAALYTDNFAMEAFKKAFDDAKSDLSTYLNERFVGRQFMLNYEWKDSAVFARDKGDLPWCKLKPLKEASNFTPTNLSEWKIDFSENYGGGAKKTSATLKSTFVGQKVDLKPAVRKGSSKILIENYLRNRYSIISMLLTENRAPFRNKTQLVAAIKELGGDARKSWSRSRLDAAYFELKGKEPAEPTWENMSADKKQANTTRWLTGIATAAGLNTEDFKHIKDWSADDSEDQRYQADEKFEGGWEAIISHYASASSDPSSGEDAEILPATFKLGNTPAGNKPNVPNFDGYQQGEEYVPEMEIAREIDGDGKSLFWKKGNSIKSQHDHNFGQIGNPGGIRFAMSGPDGNEFLEINYLKVSSSPKLRRADIGNLPEDPDQNLFPSDKSDTTYTTAGEFDASGRTKQGDIFTQPYGEDTEASNRTNVGVDDAMYQRYYDAEVDGSYSKWNDSTKEWEGTPEDPASGTTDARLKSSQVGTPKLVGEPPALDMEYIKLMTAKNPDARISIRQLHAQGRLSKEFLKSLGLMERWSRRLGRMILTEARVKQLSDEERTKRHKKRNRKQNKRYRNYRDALAPNSEAEETDGKYKLTLKDLLDSGVIGADTKKIPDDFKVDTFKDHMKQYDHDDDGTVTNAEWFKGKKSDATTKPSEKSAKQIEYDRKRKNPTAEELGAATTSTGFKGPTPIRTGPVDPKTGLKGITGYQDDAEEGVEVADGDYRSHTFGGTFKADASVNGKNMDHQFTFAELENLLNSADLVGRQIDRNLAYQGGRIKDVEMKDGRKVFPTPDGGEKIYDFKNLTTQVDATPDEEAEIAKSVARGKSPNPFYKGKRESLRRKYSITSKLLGK